jgi:hypothetical protein
LLANSAYVVTREPELADQKRTGIQLEHFHAERG